MVFYADRLPDYDMWLYVEVSLDQLNLIRSSKIDLHDTFSKPKKNRLIKALMPRSSSVDFDSIFVSPSDIDDDVFPSVGDCLDIEYTPLSIQPSVVESTKFSDRDIITIR